MSESSRTHKAAAPTSVGFAVVMCSSSRFAKLKGGQPFNDPSGDLIVQSLERNNHSVILRRIVPDDKNMIMKTVADALQQQNIKTVIICGGTGISPKDLTIEAVKPTLQKTLPGFGELFRKLSYEIIGSAAIMSRAVAGVVNGKVVFCIPGSIDAVDLCLNKLILPEIGHILKHVREQ
ncbi:MAG: MogA/MoaB family molybdenum cofactor biosynthesis protein [Candidatus Bathyarchaeota archaeon]|jgi:molybdenum cofactor biosynthesis protein B|nr:MogA/MoaB family molybdenum cofactor biosynthesis protein [Candidatus Bathyarchaeota archaeon]